MAACVNLENLYYHRFKSLPLAIERLRQRWSGQLHLVQDERGKIKDDLVKIEEQERREDEEHRKWAELEEQGILVGGADFKLIRKKWVKGLLPAAMLRDDEYRVLEVIDKQEVWRTVHGGSDPYVIKRVRALIFDSIETTAVLVNPYETGGREILYIPQDAMNKVGPILMAQKRT